MATKLNGKHTYVEQDTTERKTNELLLWVALQARRRSDLVTVADCDRVRSHESSKVMFGQGQYTQHVANSLVTS